MFKKIKEWFSSLTTKAPVQPVDVTITELGITKDRVAVKVIDTTPNEVPVKRKAQKRKPRKAKTKTTSAE